MSNIATFKSAEVLTMQERHAKEIADRDATIKHLTNRMVELTESEMWGEVRISQLEAINKELKDDLHHQRHRYLFNERECLALRECITKLEDELAAWKFKYKEALRWRNEGAD